MKSSDQFVKKKIIVSMNILFLTIIILMAAFGQPVTAQTSGRIEIATLDVSLYPEFNRPSMLVMYSIELDENTPLPAEITLQIPIDAQSLSTTNLDEDDNVISLNTEAVDIGLWKDVHFTAITRNIQVEYYDPNLVKEGVRRTFEFEWLSIYPVNSLRITIRQPFGASNVHSEPSLDRRFTGAGNIEYYTKELGPIPAGNLFSLIMIYTKNPSNPAYPALVVEPAVTINEETPGKTPSPLSVVLWLLSFAVAVLIMVGLYYWWFHTTTVEEQERVVKGVGIMNPEKQVVFCHECGRRSSPGDSYCSNCGTELRRPKPFQKTPQIKGGA